jgi:uncharacterized membrane protein YjgN (DUF898 family)
MQAPARAATAPVTAPGQTMPFRFTGSGGEYFRIWIVNLLLTLVTLGVYSAWAKVRRNRYFYGHTRLGDAAFEYRAQPLAILKGRLIAFAALALYLAVSELWLAAQLVFFVAFLALLPWLAVKALAFRAHNTAFRNLRFDFRGSYGEALVVYVLLPLLIVFTLGLIVPFIAQRQRRFVVAGSRYGTKGFDFGAAVADFYKEYLLALLILVAGALLIVVLLPVLDRAAPFVGLPVYVFLYAFLKARIANLVYNGAHLDGHGFRSTLSAFELTSLYLTNTVAIVLTLGLYVPWARVRMARYRAGRLVLVAAGDLDGFVAAQREQVASTGEEVSELFDVDIGL